MDVTAPAQLITAPPQPSTTGVSAYAALFNPSALSEINGIFTTTWHDTNVTVGKNDFCFLQFLYQC